MQGLDTAACLQAPFLSMWALKLCEMWSMLRCAGLDRLPEGSSAAAVMQRGTAAACRAQAKPSLLCKLLIAATSPAWCRL